MEEKTDFSNKKVFALVGKNISYSFSRAYFSDKFEKEGINDAVYINFDIENIDLLPEKIKNTPTLRGMNVTIPYKEEIMPFLSEIDETAEKIGAVNTIKILSDGKLKGYNTDYYGFLESIKPFLKSHHKKALILGTGGASKAVAYALSQLGINYKYVSRNPKLRQYAYSDLSASVMKNHTIIINCTPLGTHPNIKDCPPIPYQYLTEDHLLYDLIYNPEETTFLQKGKNKKATICNGQKMLELQAEKSWEIWNDL